MLWENIKFLCTSKPSVTLFGLFFSECKYFFLLWTKYVYWVYRAISKSPKHLSNFTEMSNIPMVSSLTPVLYCYWWFPLALNESGTRKLLLTSLTIFLLNIDTVLMVWYCHLRYGYFVTINQIVMTTVELASNYYLECRLILANNNIDTTLYIL
jgi:hypothetical protein